MGSVKYGGGIVAASNLDSIKVPAALGDALHEFSAHIRNPEVNPAPANIEARRMKIYSDLFYRNIEGFISSAFPVLRSISPDEYWQALVREFMVQHRAKTPYFSEIAQEFLHYLQQRQALNCEGDFPFILELAHYEWVELALDTAESDVLVSADWPVNNAEQRNFKVSPLVWCLAYQYPVHRIGPEFIPVEVSKEPINLLVYRNAEDEVGFMEVNAVTMALLQLIQNNPQLSLYEVLKKLALAVGTACDESFVSYAQDLLLRLYRLDIILVSDT